ncbi:MAG: hypothetical protein IJ220_06575 [Clostridia bacterium]|nr:hypothetical protein [Clostridia bacterium]
MSISVSVLENVQKVVANSISDSRRSEQMKRAMIDTEPIHFKTVVELPVDQFYRNVFEKLGFSFTSQQKAILPKGWKVKVDDSSVKLIDNLGRIRGNFYAYGVNGNQKTVVELNRRYRPIFQYSEDDTQVAGCILDNATGEIIHEVWRGERDCFNAFDVSASMHEYLKKYYPDWEDFCAYW